MILTFTVPSDADVGEAVLVECEKTARPRWKLRRGFVVSRPNGGLDRGVRRGPVEGIKGVPDHFCTHHAHARDVLEILHTSEVQLPDEAKTGSEEGVPYPLG